MTNRLVTKFKETELGPIPEEGDTVRLGDIAGIQQGRYLPPGLMAAIPNISAKIPVWGANGVIGYTDKPSFEEAVPLVTCRGNGCGLVQWTSGPAYISNNAMAIVIPETTQTDNVFLYYALLSTDFQDVTTGSAQPQITMGHLINKQIPWQRTAQARSGIASILSSLDDKIELNRQINANLEKMASALFKRWFVDFEFPDKNGKPYKSSGGKMVELEMGEIPEGWRVGRLSEIADITIGRTPPRMEEQWFSTNPSDKKWISIRDMGSCGVYINQTAEYLTREAIKKFNIPVIPKNTVVVSFKLTVGRVAITADEMLSNEAIAHIKLIDSATTAEYVYCLLKRFDFTSLASTSSIATAVNSKSIKEIPIQIPKEEQITQFMMLIKPIFQTIMNNEQQIRVLVQARDSLLPRLMSGKISTKT